MRTLLMRTLINKDTIKLIQRCYDTIADDDDDDDDDDDEKPNYYHPREEYLPLI
ncbi:hypothetical protein THAOC_25074, partial [Thalassiosira oceanica]